VGRAAGSACRTCSTKLTYAPGPLRGDHAELGAVASDGVDQHGPLANQELAGSMEDKNKEP
jgi:hypothetical protein